MTWILFFLSLVGTVLNVWQRREGFYFWVIANLGWIHVDMSKGIYAQAVQMAIYVVMAIYGLSVWKKEDEESDDIGEYTPEWFTTLHRGDN